MSCSSAAPAIARTFPCTSAASDAACRLRALQFSFPALYVRIMLLMLSWLLSTMRHLSEKIQTEIDYLQPGYTFMLKVEGTDLACVCQRKANGSFRRIPLSRVADDVEPGSGLPSNNPTAVTVDYVITFRSISYAFDCFSGRMSLQQALAQRAFSTRGPNDTGVALTYMFTALLKMFFGWRKAYRK